MPLSDIARPIGSLANPRAIVGVLMIAIAIASGIALSGGADSSISVLAASRDLSVSRPLSLEDFTAVKISLPESNRSQLVLASEAADAAGMRPTRPLRAGELVTRNAFARSAEPFQEVALAIPPEAPLDSRLVVGDRVDLVATLGKGSVDARTVVLARDAEVVEFSIADDSSSLAGASSQQVVVGVKPAEVLPVIHAMHNGELALVRSAPSPTPSPLPVEVGSEDLGDGQ
ncbi:MAG: hypothetical protein DCC49_07185 [Acidobacteria bacterium]|nr:MAG: hypothetical protein DCC49_07185 [Acidobacteriota bacterium]